MQKQHVRIVLLAILAAALVQLSVACTKKAQGKITGWYRPLEAGMAQMYINVELDDGTEVDALLMMRPPYFEEQNILEKVSGNVQRGGHLWVEIQRHRWERTWKFVKFLDG